MHIHKDMCESLHWHRFELQSSRFYTCPLYFLRLVVPSKKVSGACLSALRITRTAKVEGSPRQCGRKPIWLSWHLPLTPRGISVDMSVHPLHYLCLLADPPIQRPYICIRRPMFVYVRWISEVQRIFDRKCSLGSQNPRTKCSYRTCCLFYDRRNQLTFFLSFRPNGKRCKSVRLIFKPEISYRRELEYILKKIHGVYTQLRKWKKHGWIVEREKIHLQIIDSIREIRQFYHFHEFKGRADSEDMFLIIKLQWPWTWSTTSRAPL